MITERRSARGSRDRRWLIGIVVGMTIMIAVNVCFIYIAVSGADEVVPSYLDGDR